MDLEDPTVEELKGYMAHIGYLAMKATSNLYIHKATMDYDTNVRIMADRRGMSVFTGGIESVSLLAFNYDNTQQAARQRGVTAEAAKRSSSGNSAGSSRGRGRQPGQTPDRRRGTCYDWNLKNEGCTNSSCNAYHTCMYCWDANHKGAECNQRGTYGRGGRGGRR